MKIRQIVFGSLLVSLLVGCSVQSKEVEKPKLQPEREVSIAWKDTLDEGLISELDRENKLTELNIKEVKETEIVENEEFETEVVEHVESNADETETVEQAQATQTASSELVAPVQTQNQTGVVNNPIQTQPKNQEQVSNINQNSESNNQVQAPKPNPTPKPEVSVPKEPERVFPDFVYEVGNSGKVFNTSNEAWDWAERQMDENYTDPNWYTRFGVRSYFVDDNSPEKWTVDFMNY